MRQILNPCISVEIGGRKYINVAFFFFDYVYARTQKMFIYIYAYRYNMTKIISVSDEAYERLKRMKDGSSFSKTIIRLTDKTKKKNLMDVVGSWKADEKLAKDIEAAYSERDKSGLKRVTL